MEASIFGSIRRRDYNLTSFFREIDKDFQGIEQVRDDVFNYNAQDLLVQNHWELPIIIHWPRSTVSFEFCSDQGDLSFGVIFVPALEEGQSEDDLEVQTVEELHRTKSGEEVVGGTFELAVEGVMFFMFDNAFDWSSNKKLSYSIQVQQPSFSCIDADRSETALPLLHECVQDIDISTVRLQDAEDYLIEQSKVALSQEAELVVLEAELKAKQLELHKAIEEERESIETLEIYFDRVDGIGIRCLNKHLLSVVMSCFDIDDIIEIITVSKYWSTIVISIYGPEGCGRVTGPEVVPEYLLQNMRKKYIKMHRARLQKLFKEKELAKKRRGHLK